MKRVGNLIIFIFILGLMQNALAQFDPSQKRELKNKVFKTEKYLKESLTNDFKLALGVNEVLLNIDIEVNQYTLYRDISGTNDKDWKKIKDLQLPSMFIESNKQSKLKEVKVITIEDILSHIKKLNIVIFTPYDVLDEKQFKQKIQEITAANFDYSDKIELNVELKKTPQFLQDNRETSISAPELKVDLERFNGISKYFWSLVGLVFLIGIVFVWMVRSSTSSLAKAVNEKEFGDINATFDTNALNNVEEVQKNEPEVEEKVTENSLDHNLLKSYHDETDRLKEIISQNYNLLQEMINVSYRLHEYDQSIILFELLPYEQKELLFNKMSEKDEFEFKKFIFDNGEELFKRPQYLLDKIQEISTVITLSLINNEYFYSYYIRNILERLETNELLSILKTVNSSEFYFVLDYTDPAKIGYLFSQKENELSWPKEYEKLSEEDVKKFLLKIIPNIEHKFAKEVYDPRLKTLPYLSDQAELEALSALGLTEDYTFTNLYKNYKDEITDKIIDLEYSELKAFISILNVEDQGDIINQLPEIVAERLMSDKLEVSEESFKLKAKFFEELKTIHNAKNGDNIDEKDIDSVA